MANKILYFDVEWKPATAYVWRMWDENITPAQLIDPGGLLCFSALWEGSREVIFHSDWEDGHLEMVRKLHELFTEADAVVTYNGDRYDIPKAMGEFLLAGLLMPPMPASIDLIKTVKKFGYVMNRLAYIGPLLDVGKKTSHEGFMLWRNVMAGDVKAQTKMKKYCIQDSLLLVSLYKKVRPFIKNHPHLGNERHACGACQNDVLHRRGYRRTKTFKIQRLQCVRCGSWQDGAREKIG